MSNHIHLAILVREVSISRVMQNVAFRYTRYINKKYNRIGHLFQGRFKSIMILGKRYLKELIRYIHLNPVRAFLVNRSENYLWSSHQANMMLTRFVWLTSTCVKGLFEGSCKDYEEFVLKGIGVKSELDFKSGTLDGVLGDEEGIEQF